MATEEEQIAQLNKSRRLATGLLLLMAVVFVAARLLPPHPVLPFVSAFAEAAMVGALADWFAVTALFRSPLGLPIPHTAIIPRNKDRIGDSLSDFLEHNFITPEIIGDELGRIDFARSASDWLARPENRGAVASQMVKGVPVLLRMVEDEDVRQFIQRRVGESVSGMKFGPIAAEVVALMVDRRHHYVLFDHLIDMAAGALERNSPYIRWKIHEASPRWLPKAIDEKLFERLLYAIQSTLDEMRDEDSEWRMRVQIATEDFITRLRTAPEYEEKIAAVAGDMFNHPSFRSYAGDLWTDIKSRLIADAQAEDSRLAARLEQILGALARDLLGDPAVQARLNQWLREAATEAIVARREMIADLVARVIRTWDAETMSRKLELHVGKDLQFIRINGTLVGGLVGLALHVVSLAL